MAEPLTCPRCQTALRVDRSQRADALTCPRCLALLDYSPAAGVTEIPAVRPAEPACPACGEPIRPGWRYCPVCEEPLTTSGRRSRPTARPRSIRRPEADASTDQRATVVCVVVLLSLVALGVVLFFAQFLGGDPQNIGRTLSGLFQFPGTTLLTILGGLLFVLLLGGTIALIVRSKGTVNKVLSTFLGTVGLAVLFVVVVILCGIVLLFEACSRGCQSNPSQSPPVRGR